MELFALLPGGGIIFTVLAFVVALSVIVAVHEYGHYIVGRWCGIHAEVFSLGFGPVLKSWVDKRGTRWQIAALPFGGYVKFLGDANAASGKDHELMNRMDPSGIERTMHGAKLWKRSATVAAGPVFNFILSILIFTAMLMVQGRIGDKPVVDRVKDLPTPIQELESGDQIVAIEGMPASNYTELYIALDTLPPAETLNYTVLRNGDEITVRGPFGFPPIVDALHPQSAAMAANLQVGDVVTAIDGTPIWSFAELRETVLASDGRSLELTVWRDGEVFETTLSPKRTDLPAEGGGFETKWLIGVNGGLVFEPQFESVGPFSALWAGVQQTWSVISVSLSGLYHMVTGAISSCNLQGPIGIAEISGQAASQGTKSFIWLIAMLSTAVGLINLFPIPVLDGGHLVFHAYEAVARKAPSDWALRVMMSAGLTLVLGFMIFAVTNDLFCP